MHESLTLATSQIVFIDSEVTDYKALATGVITGIKVVILDSNRDGIEQINAVLRQKSYSKVHIVSHGSPGCLYLGNNQLSLDTVERYTKDLKTWFSNYPLLQGEGLGVRSILIYGCNVAAGDAGTEFIAKLRNLTGAEILASTTPIGNSSLGGNWNLDVSTAFNKPQLAFSEEIQKNYAGVFRVINGNVFIDYNNDGIQQLNNDAEEVGYENITIVAYEANNQSTYSTNINPDGSYTLTVPDNTPLRIEFGNLPEGFVSSSIAGGDSVSDLLFLDGTNNDNITANFGIIRPSDITTGNATDIDLVTVCYVVGIGGASDSGVVIHNYNDAGSPTSTPIGNTAPYATYTNIANFQQVGTVNGLAHHRESDTLFAGSFYKRHSALLGTIDFTNDGNANAITNDANGAAYTSVIYTISNDGSNTVTEFARLDDVIDPRGNINGSTYDWDTDALAFAAVGKTGLGDVELSEDGQTLWAVNLNDNKLYELPVGNNSDPLNPTPPSAGEINDYDIINQILSNGNNLGVNPQQNIRPFALSTRDGLVYIGMVNTAQYDANGIEGNTTAADLRAFVYTFDPSNPSAAPVQALNIPLNYERDQVINNNQGGVVLANWNPWTDTFPTGLETPFVGEVAYPQPILSDLEFDPDGNMILGFRDRWGDQLGYGVNSPDGSQTNLSSDSAGDLLQAIYNNDTDSWTIETHVTEDGINGNNQPDGEFYRNEFLEDDNNTNDSQQVHAETAQGGLTNVPGFTELVTTAMDPVDAFSGGLEWFNTEDGSFVVDHQVTENRLFGGTTTAHGLEIFSSDYDGGPVDSDNFFGKANGLGDLEFIAAAATIEVGNRIWFDLNQDGIQNVGELDVPDGVTVEIYNIDDGGSFVAQTTTTNGQYSFSGLAPFTNYEVRLVASDFNPGGLLEGYQSTLQNVGSNDALDSDATNSGGVPIIALTTGASGTNDFTYDIGLTNIPTYDYGDAPDTGDSPSTGTENYQTLATDNGARHLLGSDLTIGNSVTADDGTLENIDADADSDDGVTFFETLQIGNSSFTANVDVNLPTDITSATLVGWIDFNRDGVFDSGEAVDTTISSSGNVPLTWNNINATSFPGIVDGSTYARFRLSTDSALDTIDNADSVGELSDGEVEDYQITIGSDYGDAPDTEPGAVANTPTTDVDYQTRSADNGASHGILNGLSMGNIVDDDNGTLQSSQADADDTNGEADEDGVTFTSSLSLSDTTYRVAVDVTNTTGSDAILTGWIDFDQSGTFDNDESVSTIFSSSGTQNLRWDSLPGLAEGTTYARFRLSTDFTTTTTNTTVPVTSTIYSEDFEGITAWRNDGLLNTGNTATAGNWAIGNPTVNSVNGTIMQPEDANSGTNALISDLSTVDIDGGAIFSRSDSFTLDNGVGTHSVTFSYFLSSFTSQPTDGFQVSIVNASDTADRAVIYTDIVATDATQAAVWNEITRTINSSFNGKTVYLEFIAQDGGTDDTVEAGVDDITVTYTEDVTVPEEVPDPLNPTGALETGEVEDYVLNVGLDYGDAPDTSAGEGTGDYQTIGDNGGPSHVIVNGLQIGSAIDADNATLQNENATADDNNNIDDEDGVTFASNLEADDTTYSATVKATNNTGSAATLVGWIDFDRDGNFELGEAVTANVPTGTNNADVTLTWDDNAGNNGTNNLNGNGDLPTTILPGTTYARFRLSTDADFDGDNALGAAGDGEVEDYKLTVGIDYGDARDTGIGTSTSNFNTIESDNGASHIIDRDLTIGSTVDADDGTLQNAAATADDNNNTDDEDGIASFSVLQTDDDNYSVNVTVNNNTGSAATLVGWIDFDHSGTFDPNEGVTAPIDNNETSETLNWSVPADVLQGITYARFRLSTDSNFDENNPIGQASDGEVEDYQINIQGIDYGDAPDTEAGTGTGNYKTLQSDDGASHLIVGGLKLGATVDAETGDLQNGAATADDLDDKGDDDDEDGITFTTPLSTADGGGTYTVDVDFTNDTGSDARIIGWIDFNQNGEFETGEGAVADSDDTTAGTQDFNSQIFDRSTTLTWNVPTSIPGGTTYARFRISNDLTNLTTSNSINFLNSGEVEDYQIIVQGGNDFGDADALGTDNYDATNTSHNIVSGLSIGSLIDDDGATPTANAAANADDTGGIDDEDGVAFTSNLKPTDTAYSVAVDVTNTTGNDAELIGWIDFDGNGTFDPDEASDEVIVSSSGQVILNWSNIPAGSQVGNTYARFRLNDNPANLSDATATGGLQGGEVEDYTFTVVEVDYGDAPDTGSNTGFGNYKTTDADGGASHIIDSNLTIGSTVDADDGTLHNSTATADDNNPVSGADDEDGIASFDPLAINADTYTVDVAVTNNTGGDATLIGWIDFDGNGAFEAEEAVTTTVQNGDTSATLTWDNNDGIADNNIPSDIQDGTTFARFRLSTDALTVNDSTGSATDGEVEDHQLEILQVYNISGTVFEDTNNPNANTIEPGDTGIPGVTLTLYAADDTGFTNSLGTAITDDNGNYSFTGFTDGNYVVVESQPTDYDSVTDSDGAPDNQISVTIAGDDVTGQDFLEEKVVAIGSTVFEDTNNNGLQDAGETGIEGVAVELYSPGADGAVGGGDDSLVNSTNTDVNGNYIFNNLPEGDYYVSIPQSNFATNGALENTPLSSANTDTADNQEDGDDNGIQGSIGNVTNSPVINLTANSEPVDAGTETAQGNDLDNGGDDADGDMTIDLGFVPVFAISGTVLSDTLNPELNAIDNPGDTPIPGVTLTLYAADDTGFTNPLGTATTDNDGNYSFTGLTDGNYVVVQTQPTQFDSVTDSDGAPDNQISVTIAGADVTGNNFLEEKVVAIGSTVFEDTNNNGLQDAGESGIEGVAVELYNPGGDGAVGGGDDSLVNSTNTDVNGNYIFNNLPEGDYYVSIPQSNFATNGALENTPLSSANTDTADNQEDGDDNGIQASSSDVTNSPVINLTANSEPVDAGTETAQGNELDNGGDDADGDMTIDFGFTSVFTVSGTVFEDTNNPNDNTIEAGDTPIPGVEVKLFADSNGDGVPDDLNNPLDTTTTDGDGNYSFTGLSNGNYVVVQTQPTGFNSVTDSDGAPDNQIAVNVNNADSTDNNFLEERPAGSVSGRVRDTDNNGINNVTLNLINSDGQIVDTVSTDNTGNYTFDYVLPGNYTVEQVQPFGYNSVSEVEGGSDEDNPDGDTTVNNRISVTVGLNDADSGNDIGNDFVEIRARDYGDAPDNNPGTGTGNYQTREADGGASHNVISGLRIGNNIDTDNGTRQNTTATADDNSAAVDDEDGVTFTSNLQTDDTTYSVNVSVTNTTNQPATLVGWIDFDRSGTFDADEAVSRTIAANSNTNTVSLTWDNNAGNNGDGNGDLPGTGALSGDSIETGTTYSRFRLSTDASLTGTIDNADSVGNLSDGEVEDHQFNIGSSGAGGGLTTPADCIFIGQQNVELTVTFDNTGAIPGYGPFVLLYLDKTGADGAGTATDDGLTFKTAQYLGVDVVQQEYTFDVNGEAQVTIGNQVETITAPSGFEPGDTVVYMELPFGSFVPDQPPADITVTVDVSDLADNNTPLSVLSQTGYKFGEDPLDNPDTDPIILEDVSSKPNDTITPQIVKITNNYLGPEDETATGPNFVQQYQIVVDIAPGQTLTNLDVSDLLPDTMQFVDVASIEIADSGAGGVNNGVTISDISTPDDGGLESISTRPNPNETENDVNSDGNPTPGGTLTRRFSSVTGVDGADDIVITINFFVPRLDASGDVIINADTGDDVFDQNQSQLGDNVTTDGNNIWTANDPRDGETEVYIAPTINDDPADPVDPATTKPDGTTDTGLTGYGDESDAGDDCNDPDHVLEEQSIAIQKGVTNLTDSGNSPGDVLQYTLNFQVSDYFAFEDIIVTDTFSDGQRFDTTFTPIVNITEQGGTSTGNLDFTYNGYVAANDTLAGSRSGDASGETLIIDETDIDNVNDGSGDTVLTFKISDELIASSFNGQLIGGGVPQGGFQNIADLNNNPPLPNGGTIGTITFQTIIQDQYSDNFPSGDASLDQNDLLTNGAIIDGAVLEVLDPDNTNDPGTPDALARTGQREDDDTAASLNIEEGNLFKTIYAVNGIIADGAATDNDLSDGLDGYVSGVEVAPGDTITYRLTYQLPISDIEELQFTDFFPLPVFDVGTEFANPTFSNTFDSTGATIPAAGQTHYGRLDTFHQITGAPDPTLSLNAGANSLNYFYGDFDDPNNNSSVVDLLVTVTTENDPFADNLLLTNQVRQSQENTFNEVSTRDAIVQITLREPVLEIKKGVVAVNSDRTDIAFNPTTASPSEITFTSGSAPTFSGVVSSTDLDTAPINSNLTGGLEAGDIVTFALAVENTGGSRKGAFDVRIQDALPNGFEIPAGGLNLNVTDGTGATLTYTRLGDPKGVGDDLFGNGIELVDPGATPANGSGLAAETDAGAIDGFNETSGTNIAIVSYDLQVTTPSPYVNPATLENTARVISYSNLEGGESFPSIEDNATVEIERPEATKSIVTTSEVHTPETGNGSSNANARQATIGEIVRYRLVARIPEGNAVNFILRDNLPNGQTFLNDGTSTVAFVSNGGGVSSSNPNGSTLNLGLGTTPANTGSSSGDATNPVTLGDNAIGSTNSITTNADNYNTGTDVRFKLGDIVNSDRDGDDEFIVVEFNALVDNNNDVNNQGNEIRNDAGDIKNNSFQIISDGVTLDTSDDVKVEVVEPVINNVQQTVSLDGTNFTESVNADSQDVVTFKVTFSNTGNSTAYDVNLADTLPTGLENLSVTNIASAGGTTGITDSSNATGLDVDITSIPVGGSVTVTYTADVIDGVAPDLAIANTADVTYTSLPGTGTTSNSTGSTTPGASGAINGERDGSNGEGVNPNDYADSDPATVNTPPLDPIKSLVATSESFTGTDQGASTVDSDLTIGEIARYRMVVQIPEGNTNNLVITDLLPAGLRYLDDGTSQVALVSDGGLTSSVIIDNNPASPNLASSDPNVTPEFDITASDSTTDANTTFESGEDPVFTLGNLANTDSDANSEFVVIEFNALVENITANQDPGTLDNSFTVSADNATARTSNVVSIDLVEPVINNVQQTVSLDGTNFTESVQADSQDVVTFQVVYSNTGNSTAYDVDLSDTLPAGELENLSVSNITSSSGVTGVVNNSNTTDLDIAVESIPVGESVTVTYTAQVVDGVAPDLNITNTADVTYTSLPGTGTASNPTGSTTPGASGAANGERNGSDGEGVNLNNYADSDPADVDINSYSIGSTVFADTNNNGLLDSGETGISGVTVQLFDDANNEIPVGADGILGTADDALGGVTTNGDGNYIFTGLEPGQYQVKIPASNFAANGALENASLSSTDTTTTDNQTDNDDNGIQSFIGTEVTSPIITLSAGDEPTTAETSPGDLDDGSDDDANGDMTVDFGFVEPLSIGSTIFEDINNNGVQDGAEPGIANVEVQLFDDGGNRIQVGSDGILGTADDSLNGAVTTDGNGNYQFDGLTPGDYKVVIPAANFNNGNALADTPTSSTDTDTADNQQDSDDNGIQTGGSGTQVESPVINLAIGTEPTGTAEDGQNGTVDDAADANGDMTVDFGFFDSGNITGTIRVDTTGDDFGDTPLPATTTLTLYDATGTAPITDDLGNNITATTDASGNYTFSNVIPGNYTIIPTLPSGYFNSAENEGGNDNDNPAGDNTLNNQISVTLNSGETDTGNDFVLAQRDYGDAPDNNYNTTGTDNPVSHEIVNGLTIGAAIDPESDGLPNATATGDDLDGSDDEDGVTFETTIIGNDDNTYSVNVIVNAPDTTTIASDRFNSNGSYAGGSGWSSNWSEAPESDGAAAGNVSVDTGVLQLRNNNNSAQRNFTIPANATGDINLTFDYAEVSGTEGAGGSGSVLNSGDDLTVSVNGTNFTVPYGSGSGTQTIDITSLVTPGSTATVEFNTDALTGVDGDDGYDIDNVVITEATSPEATLVGWIDFDGNGTFEASEATVLDTAGGLNTDGVTANTLTWDGGASSLVPDGTTVGDTYARFRLSTDPSLTASTPAGLLTDGEVEDYQLSIYNTIDGYTYPETITGTSGNDRITGLDGQDTLTGGDGADVFVYTKTSDGIDRITDFNPNEDKLDFRAIADNELSTATVPPGSNLFAEGYVKAINFGTAGVMIQVDPDASGDIFAKNVVLLKNDSGITASSIDADDFIF